MPGKCLAQYLVPNKFIKKATEITEVYVPSIHDPSTPNTAAQVADVSKRNLQVRTFLLRSNWPLVISALGSHKYLKYT